MDRTLDSLSSQLRPLIFEVLARLVERGVMVMIVQTSRTLAEHEVNLANGTSGVKLSKHLPRGLRGFPITDADFYHCDAIDLCPYETYQAHGPDKLNWNTVMVNLPNGVVGTSDPGFMAIVEEGERVGLRSGGRWRKPHDPGHLELVLSTMETVNV